MRNKTEMLRRQLDSIIDRNADGFLRAVLTYAACYEQAVMKKEHKA